MARRFLHVVDWLDRRTSGVGLVTGALFVAGAIASQRIAFTGVGVAFIALGAVMLLRQRKGGD